jgi:hypothetical protein
MTSTTIETSTASKTHPCLCGQIRIDIPAETDKPFNAQALPRNHRAYLDTVIGDEAGWVYLETMCDQETKRTFAPGHDARVKGLLITAARLNGDVTVLDGGMAKTTDPLTYASQFGFAEAVAAGAKRPVKSNGKPVGGHKPKTTAKPTVKAKVGRWVYEGTVEAGDEFHYTTKSGAKATTFQYTLIEG